MLNQSGQDFDTDLDEFVICAAAFNRLRELVKLWMYDHVHLASENAQEILINLYSWLTDSTGSKMYDPLLHRMIHKMMSKNFYCLLQRFKQLGC